MSTIVLDNLFAAPRDGSRAESLVSALEAPYVEAVVRAEVKVKIDQTIERYSASKSLLELLVLSVPLCLELQKIEPDQRRTDDIDQTR